MRKSGFSLVGFALGASASVGLLHAACSSTVEGQGQPQVTGGAAGESSSGGAPSGGTGQGGDAGGDASGGQSGGPDTTPPSVVSSTPEDGGKGVSKDAEIVVVFSEPMNQQSVEDAYLSDTLPAKKVTFEWNAAGDTLTITPDDPLAYAEGSDPAGIVAKMYEFSIGEGAEDLAGNALPELVSISFSTKRAFYVELELEFDNNLTMGLDSGSGAHTPFVVGDDLDDIEYKFFVSYDMAPLPQAADITGAMLSVTQKDGFGAPYASMGPLVAVPISFNSLGAAQMEQASLWTKTLTLSSSAAVEAKYLELTAPFEAAYTSQREYFQLRFEFTNGPSLNAQRDQTVFDLPTMKLAVNYTLD